MVRARFHLFCCVYALSLVPGRDASADDAISPGDGPFSREEALAFARDVLGATDLQGVGLERQNRYAAQFAPRLAAACDADPALGERAVRRAVQLVQAAQERRAPSDGNDEGNGNNFASILTARIGEHALGFGTLRVAWRLYLHDFSGQFAHLSWPSLGGWDRTLALAFDNAGGWNDRAAGLRGILEPLRDIIGRDPPGLMLAGFAGFARLLDPWELIVVRDAAERLARSDEPMAPLARMLSAALRLERCRRLGPLPEAPDAGWLKENGAWLGELRRLVEDPRLPDANRFALAAHLVRDLAPWRDAAIIRSGMEAGTAALERDLPTRGDAWEPLLIAFNAQPADEAWRSSAERFRQAWVHRARFDGNPAGSLHRFHPSPECVYHVLELTARLGHEAEFKAMARFHRLGSTQTFVLMVRHGLHGAARDWLRESPPHRFAEKVAGLEYRAGDERAVEAFCATLNDPEDELLARIHVANNPPSDSGEPRVRSVNPPPRWDTRMAALVPMFRGTRFAREQRRNLCLFLLSDSPSAALLLRDEIARSPLRAPVLGKNSRYPEMFDGLRVASGYVCNGLAEGTTRPLEEILEAVGRLAGSRDDWRYTTSISFLMGEIYEAAVLLLPPGDPAVARHWREALDASVKLCARDLENADGAIPLMGQAALHALCGGSGDLEKARAALSPEARARCEEVIRDYRGDLPSLIGGFCRKNTDDLRPWEERKRVILCFLADPWLHLCSSGDEFLLHSLVKRGLATPEELLGMSTEIAATDQGQGRRLRELAALAWDADRRDVARAFLDQAAATTRIDGSQARYQLAGREAP